MENDTCADCGDPFARRAMNQRYCSARCREAAAAERRGGWYYKLGPAEGALERDCSACGETFRSDSTIRRYCSDRCKWRAKARRQHGHEPMARQAVTCSGADCDRKPLARGLCPGHYKAWRRRQGFADATSGGGRKHGQRHIERAKRYGLPWERFEPSEVFERDGWVCGICGDPVDRNLKHPDRLSASLDHVVPIVQGGGHLRDNCQCSHLTCNLKKKRGPKVSRVLVAA